MKFRVHTALHEESSDGWIWASNTGLRPRSIVQITNRETARSVHCEYREIDTFFLRRFNRDKPHGASEMTLEENPIAIGLWYRAALGIPGVGKGAELELAPQKFKGIAAIRAGSQHPDVMTRLATRLGILGAWLGVTSIVVSLLSLNPNSLLFRAAAIGFAILTGIAGLWLSKGVKE
jgi:hypothetical protein